MFASDVLSALCTGIAEIFTTGRMQQYWQHTYLHEGLQQVHALVYVAVVWHAPTPTALQFGSVG